MPGQNYREAENVLKTCYNCEEQIYRKCSLYGGYIDFDYICDSYLGDKWMVNNASV